MKALPYEPWRTNTERGYNGIRVRTADELNNDIGFYDLRDGLTARGALDIVIDTQPEKVTGDKHKGYFPLFVNENFGLYVIKGKSAFYPSLVTNSSEKVEDSLKVSEANGSESEAEASEPNDQTKIYAAAMEILDDFITARRFNKESSFVNRKTLLSLIAAALAEKLQLSDVYARDIVDRLAKDDTGFIARLANVSR